MVEAGDVKRAGRPVRMWRSVEWERSLWVARYKWEADAVRKLRERHSMAHCCGVGCRNPEGDTMDY